MTAREEFNRMLNACYDPIRVYNVLSALASNADVQNAEDPREAVCRYIVKREVPEQEVKHA